MSELKKDLAATQRVQGLIQGATVSGRDAATVAAVLQYLAHIERFIAQAVADEETASEKDSQQEAQ